MKKLIYSAALVCTLMLAACSDNPNYSPQEILNEAMQETTTLTSYYSEYSIVLSDGTEMYAKQWNKDGKTRVELTDSEGDYSIAINDGTTLTSYTKSSNTAYIFNLGEHTEDFAQPTLQEQAMRTLEMIKDTHDITNGKDEEIAGRDTYHLIAKAKKDNTLIGDMEIWVDKKTWMVLKSVSDSGDLTMTSEYTRFDENAKIDDAQFVADLPDDAIIEEETYTPPATITLEEAEQKLGKFLTFPESTGYTITVIEDMNMEETSEIAITYEKDGIPQFNMSVFKPLYASDDTEDEVIEVRGHKGTKLEMEGFRFMQWDEGGLRYNIIIENPDLSMEDILALTTQLQ